jgi:small-conductance mechanosensitive channel/CRP-like cAMP-binding protein
LPPGFYIYFQGWLAFWAVLCIFNFLEALSLQIYSVRGLSFPIPSLLRNILRFVFLLIVVFVILKFALKVDISPLLASTALLTAVIGFALQGVLGNLLSGMSLHLTRSIMPGDWVAVGEEEGRVVRTNWRETRLRTVGGHTIVVPNSLVASEVIQNLTTPTPLRRHEINVGASYSDAPGDVIEAMIKAALCVEAVLRRPRPTAYVTEFQDYGINYVLRYWTKRYHDRVPIDGDVSRMIWYEFKRQGIEIPFPMSDKLLNDFMAVVYRQRKLPPDDGEVDRIVRVLSESELISRFLTDTEGKPLLSDAEIRDLAASLKFARYTDKEKLFQQGDEGEDCYIVVSGKLQGRIEYRGGIPPQEFEIVTGALLGEMSLITGMPRTASVIAVGEVELLRITTSSFTGLLALRSEIPERLSRVASERAAKNAATLESLKALKKDDLAESLKRENILKRLLRFVRSSGK